MLVRRDLFLEVGGFDPDFFAFFEDVDFGWRLNVLGHDVWYTPRATAYHRHHSTAKRIQPQKLRALYERNALATIYKCYDDQNLAVALPAALMLLNERALRMSKLDARRFELGGAATSPPFSSVQPPASSLTLKARRVLREEGFLAACRRSVHVVLAIVVDGLIAVLNAFGAPSYRVSGVAASHYVALSQFAHLLDSLNEKRVWIQSRRQRSDAEILPLFEEPFFVGHNDERYIQFFQWLCRVQGLDRRVSSAQD